MADCAKRSGPQDRNVRLVCSHVSIDAFAGRCLEAERNLYKAIVGNLESLGIPRSHVKILLREVTKENWGMRGGQSGCDVELGKLEV